MLEKSMGVIDYTNGLKKKKIFISIDSEKHSIKFYIHSWFEKKNKAFSQTATGEMCNISTQK